ncbi:MAG: T9SS type A sorting domain-containing protein, partial [Bacteroidales bacterium]|nr:T9SS type A sorting domain-containing protein [Bacteroidales bacterium]
SETAIATITGIDEIASSISVYPNPASDIVTISADEAITHIEIVSITGQTLRTEEVNSDRIDCNIESIPAGTYLIRIFGNTNVYVKKLVIK